MKIFRDKVPATCCLMLGLWLMFTVGMCDAAPVDWSSWRAVPVLDQGRLMPLDTFARCVVRDIVGRENPKLAPPEDTKSLDPQVRAAVERLFPDGKTRKFSAVELLYCWIVEPEVWEYIPILEASNETIRTQGLDLPVRDAEGNRLKHASPSDFDRAPKIGDLYRDMERREREAEQYGEKFVKTNEDRALLELIEAYNLYRSVVFNPRHEGQVSQAFQGLFLDVVGTWRGMATNLAPWTQVDDPNDALSVAIRETKESVQDLSKQFRSADMKIDELAKTASRLAVAADTLAVMMEKSRDKVFEVENPRESFLQEGRGLMNRLAAESSRLAIDARRLELALYDEGRSLRVVPTVNRLVLEKNRDQATLLQPWINLQTLLYSPDSVLDRFPIEKVASLRECFDTAKRDFQKIVVKGDPQADAKRVDAFNRSLRKFTEELRSLGETLSVERAKFAPAGTADLDENLLARTAYPPVGAFDVELKYNRVDPFLWAWILTLAAVVLFTLAWGYPRTGMMLLAIVVLTLGQLATGYGLGLRMTITKMVPVTNMYETILFVGLTAGFLCVCIAIYPMIQSGLSTAWRLTAWPRSPEGCSFDESQRRVAGLFAAEWIRWALFAIRLGLAVGVIYFLAIGEFSPSHEKSALSFLPRIAGQGIGGMLGAVVLWIVGMAILAWAVWFIPRALPTLVLAVVLIPHAWWLLGFRDGLKKTVERRLYLVAGSIVTLLIYLVGYWSPQSTFNRDVGVGMAPVLRNNFWLTIHVLIITASYGAGAIAWGIGNLSAACYLFGRYTENKSPRLAHTLADYIYRMMQIAVLLLAAGTITGAIWADFAWGRYWGWDPKEVWALITLFVYLAILHGRWARWIGDFGMAIGSVFGFTSILIAWYGVNLLDSGLHSYGAISGGFYYVLILAALNWLFILAAYVRYLDKRYR